MNRNDSGLSIFSAGRLYGAAYWFFWLAGIFASVRIYSILIGDYVSLMCRFLQTSVSIVGLLCVLFFPLIQFFILTKCKAPLLLFFFLFFCGLFFGFHFVFFFSCFYHSFWFVAVLCMFSKVCMVVPIHYLWYYSIPGGINTKKAVLWYCVVALIVGLVDYFIISPMFIRFIGSL